MANVEQRPSLQEDLRRDGEGESLRQDGEQQRARLGQEGRRSNGVRGEERKYPKTQVEARRIPVDFLVTLLPEVKTELEDRLDKVGQGRTSRSDTNPE